MSQLDLLIRGANVIDGTASPMRRMNVGVRDGRIVTDVEDDAPTKEILDAEGLMLTPGFVDPIPTTTRSSAGTPRPRPRICTA